MKCSSTFSCKNNLIHVLHFLPDNNLSTSTTLKTLCSLNPKVKIEIEAAFFKARKPRLNSN